MIKKRYIEKAYQISLLCDKCGASMKKTGIVYCTLPPDFQYKCPNCGNIISSHQDIDKIYYEYEDFDNEL